jgi:hypothetical protein
MQSALDNIPQADEARLRAAILEQKLVVTRLVSEGRNAGKANAALYQLTDRLFRMRSVEAI